MPLSLNPYFALPSAYIAIFLTLPINLISRSAYENKPKLHLLIGLDEKGFGLNNTKSLCVRAMVRLQVVIPIWFMAIIFPFFGPINSAVGALLVSFTVYIVPALPHMLTYRTASARRVATYISRQGLSVRRIFLIRTRQRNHRPFCLAGLIYAFAVVWVLVLGFGFGGWASITNFIRQINTFGLFAKCYQHIDY